MCAPIRNNRTTFLDGAPLDESIQRSDDIAKETMLHIGGFYISYKKSENGDVALGGTYGCFGVVDPSQVLLKSQTKVLLDDYRNQHSLPDGINPSNDEMYRIRGLIESRQTSICYGLVEEPILYEIQKEKIMKQDKVFLNLDKEILWGGFGVLLIIFSIIISYKSKDSSVSCSGGNSERLYDQLLNIDELNTKGALFEVNIPSTNIGVKTNEDYFNLGITSFNEKTSSYLVEGDKITLYEDFSRATYFLCLKQKERDTLIELRFKIPQVKSIDFIGKGKNGYFYFTVGYDLFELGNKYNNCTKLLIRSDGVIMVSDY